uniref:CSON012272 protein n=1 Tax=Culicoides sonorensis TaxID=179676 RepID=A0A336LQY8_CULSO
MANPRNVRKFSEKIALHNQKQAEETAEFEKIMREVQGVTVKETNIMDESTTHKSRSTEIFKRVSPSTSREYKGSGRQAGGPIRHKRPEYATSPYHNSTMSYLSPPIENNWRRSSSDSAIHQTVNHITLQEATNHEQSNMASNTVMNRKIPIINKSAQTVHDSHISNYLEVRPRSSSQIAK